MEMQNLVRPGAVVLAVGAVALPGLSFLASLALPCLWFLPWGLLCVLTVPLWSGLAPSRRAAWLGSGVTVLLVFGAGLLALVGVERTPLPDEVMCEDFVTPLALFATPLWVLLAALSTAALWSLKHWVQSRLWAA